MSVNCPKLEKKKGLCWLARVVNVWQIFMAPNKLIIHIIKLLVPYDHVHCFSPTLRLTLALKFWFEQRKKILVYSSVRFKFKIHSQKGLKRTSSLVIGDLFPLHISGQFLLIQTQLVKLACCLSESENTCF